MPKRKKQRQNTVSTCICKSFGAESTAKHFSYFPFFFFFLNESNALSGCICFGHSENKYTLDFKTFEVTLFSHVSHGMSINQMRKKIVFSDRFVLKGRIDL